LKRVGPKEEIISAQNLEEYGNNLVVSKEN